MVDFAKLRNSSASSLEKLTTELQKLNTQESRAGDDRFWQPQADKAGNGFAIIRFLPAPGEEDVPFVRVWDHGFKGPTGKWYIETSLTTIGKPDPVSEYNSELWALSDDDNSDTRKQVRRQKRKLNFISNIYIVQDSAAPENNGKVKLFKYGKKIFDKLNEAMNPQFADEKAMNPFDLWTGANFKLKIRNVEGYRNYDKSEFDAVGPLFEDDKKLEVIWKQEHSLQAFLDASKFKSYDELKARLQQVLGLNSAGNPTAATHRAAAATRQVAKDTPPWDDDGEQTQQAPARPARQQRTVASAPAAGDEDMDYFRKLAQED